MTIRLTAGLVTFSLLAACNSAAPVNNITVAPPAPAANVTAAAPATPPVPAASNAAGAVPQLTTAFLIGSWSNSNRCDRPDVVFNADGTTDGGTWELRGNQAVRTTPEGEDPPLDIRVVAQDRMAVSFAGLPEQVFTRCPG